MNKIKLGFTFLFLGLFSIFVFPVHAEEASSTSNFYIFRRGNGAGDVIVKKNNEEILNCGDNCAIKINEDTNLFLSAKARSGSVFKGWSVNSDNSYGNPQTIGEDLSLRSTSSKTIVYAKFISEKLPDNPIVSAADRDVARVMFWFGKVNQHWNLEIGAWETDSDGFSGARENKLSYCQKFYPDTIKVVPYKEETANTWKDAGNLNNYFSKKMSYRCVQKTEKVDGEDASNVVEKPNKGSVCYYFPNLPLCLPLSNPLAQRSALTLKIDNFINNGVDKNTEKLGVGERAAVIKSYEQAFKKLPETEAELSDAIKIGNGQWPSQTSEAMEKTAVNEFKKIYKRLPNLENKNDQAAIKVMAYGLRQKAENRNIKSEAAALKTFKAIYGRTPTSTLDWNILQGITYSGASRELDSDGDLLSDRREKELGTDPNNKDSDGDGYFDGMEVANSYNPLVPEKEE